MKIKISLAVLGVAVALVIGFFLGRFQVIRSVDQMYLKLSMPDVRRDMADFSRSAGILKAIHSGDTNEAIQTLEEDLDTKILLIGAAFEGTPVAQRDKGGMSRIRWLRTERAAHPWKSSYPGMNEEVARILSLVDSNP
jgi:hypothetical protein